MLSPRYLDNVSEEITELYSQLENDILQRIAKRISKMGEPTDATKWQAKILAESGGIKSDVNKILKSYDSKIKTSVINTVTEAINKSTENDNKIFYSMTGRKVSAPNAQTMLSIIQQTYNDLARITQTTALESEREFIKQANRAFMNTQSGAFSYDETMKTACDDLAKNGIHTVSYNNGRPITKSIETAVRMNILTSINHTAANITLNNCEVLDCDLVEVSAHAGARPEHAEWQGRIFSVSGKNKNYPNFSICRLGEVDGLCGINCRHSFYPYFEGMEEQFNDEELGELKDSDRYEREQEQRLIERNIRKYKRRSLIEEAGGVDNTRSKLKIGEWQAKARDHAEKYKLNRDYRREWIGTKNGKQTKGIQHLKADRLIPKSEVKATVESVKLFPGENFTEMSKNVFIAESRKPINKQETIKLEKEKVQAKILASYGHTVYLVPETHNRNAKEYDAIVDGYKTEFKTVTGNIRAVGANYRKALKQGDNIFIRTSEKSTKEIYSKLIGETKIELKNDLQINKKGIVYIWLDNENKLYRWKIKDIIEKIKK